MLIWDMNPRLHLSQTELKRNRRIVADYKSHKYSMVELVIKYRISSSRIYYIVCQERDKRGQFAR